MNKQSFKEKSFFYLVLRYSRKHPILVIFLLLSCIVTSFTTIFLSIILTSIIACLNGKNYLQNKNKDADWINTELSNKMINVHVDNKNVYAKFLFFDLQYSEWFLVLLVSFAIILIFQYIAVLLSGLLGKNIQVGTRNEAMESLIRQDISFYSMSKIGETITKMASDTMIIGDQCEIFLSDATSSAIMFVVGTVIMFLTDSKVAWVVIGITIFIFILISVSVFITGRMVTKLRKTITEVNGYCTDRIASIRLIKSNATEDYENEMFNENHKKYLRETMKNETTSASFMMWIWVCVSSIQVVSVITIAYIYKNNPGISILITSFVSVCSILTGPLIVLLKLIPDFVRTKISIKRINTFIFSKPRFDFHYNDGILIDKIEGDIYLKDIEFRYPEKPDKLILPLFNYKFEQGKSYAFVGRTGSGKSTISRLLLRFYDPTKGEVIINKNINIKDVNLSSYLSRVGYVEQEPQIIFGTVLENIKYSQEYKTDEEAIEAAKKASLHDIIMTWPNKYETILGERGFMLSGGQKQRLVISRMFLKNPDLLILDEATSALDNVVEKEIQVKLDELTKGRTTVIIAHRLSTIKNCDKIIVLDSGKGIVQEGTFNDLVKKEGYFKKLYEAGKSNG